VSYYCVERLFLKLKKKHEIGKNDTIGKEKLSSTIPLSVNLKDANNPITATIAT
jgi:hypothetical protein